MDHRLPFAIAFAALAVACSSAKQSENPSSAWPVDPKTGLRAPDLGPVPPLPVWPDVPVTDASVALGTAVFSDARLSGSGRTSCTNCHFPPNDFQSGGPKDAPDRSYPAITPTLPRNTPSFNNIVYAKMARWDGAFFTNLFDISVLPFAEANMNAGSTLAASDVEGVDLTAAQAALYKKLTVTIPGYVALFQDAFGKDIRTMTPGDTWTLVGQALAVYERRAVSRDSAFDRWNAGDDSAMNAAQVRGFALFYGAAGCVLCHSGPLFTDFAFHNIGLWPPSADGGRPDEGRYLVTGKDADKGAFLTPTLRSAADTSPYFHDGSQVSLTNVIAMKSTPASRSQDPNRDPAVDTIPQLTDGQISDIIAFVGALRGAPLPANEVSLPVTLPQ